jgi:penicillin-binding protein 1B
MIRQPNRTIVAAATVFLVVTAAVNVAIATLYSRAAARLRTAPPLGERDVRLLARPLRLAVGQRVTKASLEDHLRRIGYYANCPAQRGCFAGDGESLTIWSRYPELPDVTIGWHRDRVAWIADPAGASRPEAIVEPETILTFTRDGGGSTSRTRSDPVPYSAIAGTPLLDAIIASEDRWFRRHHGVDFARLAMVPFVRGGASTVTMQVARLSVLQDRSRTIPRKLNEIGAAMVIERLYPKEAIMAAYVNTVDLGARRGRPVHGFGAAAQEFFGVSDVRELSVVQAATLVALLNQPSRYLDDLNEGDDTRLRRQRNRVLRLMQRNFPDRYAEVEIRRLERTPAVLAAPGAAADLLQRTSRHFLDYADAALPSFERGRVYLTLDPALQRIAVDAVARGLTDLQRVVAPSVASQLQAALIAVDPRTGEVLAMVGGRSYDESQFNRSASAARQLGSIIKPFDYLAAFERAAAEGTAGVGADTIVVDEPAVFTFPGRRPWRPANYGKDYAGAISWRRALAESRNVAAVKVAAWAGLDRVARLWEGASGQTLRDQPPSLALGAIGGTPADVARAYATLASGGIARPLATISTVVEEGRAFEPPRGRERRVASASSVAAVTDMMRAVFEEGTARAARAAGFTADAAGKTGTTNDLRDAWFAGFTSDLLAVVWVGRDDNHPLGLTGAQGALPMWTEFMKRAVVALPAQQRRE